MILYLVKWEDGSAALVNAADEGELVDTLDQLADPHAASWVPYDGPLWIELDLAGKDPPPGDVDPEQVGELNARIADTDDGYGFRESLLESLHPELWKVRQAALDEERQIPRAEFDRAVAMDLVWALPCSTAESDGGPEH